MAFSTGKESTEGGVVKRYIGVAPVNVIAVNPTKAELEKIYNTTLEKDIEYTGVQEVNGKQVPTVRIDFIVKTDAEKEGIDMTTKVTFFLRKEFRYNKEATKVQVIDIYGRTAWVTKEQAQNHEIPQYKNGPANLDKDYRPCYNGEEDLTDFIKAYLNIPNVQKYVNGKWVLNSNLDECRARLDDADVAALFNGNFASVKEIISYQPNNKVKVMFGVKTNNDGKQYQTAFTQKVLKNGATDYSAIKKVLDERKEQGAYSTTEFSVEPLQEYNPKPTDINDMPEASNPSDWFTN